MLHHNLDELTFVTGYEATGSYNGQVSHVIDARHGGLYNHQHIAGLDVTNAPFVNLSISDIVWYCNSYVLHSPNLFNTLLWRHNGRDGVSLYQPHDCLLNHSFKRRSRETSKLRLTGLWGIHRWPVNSPHKWPVARKMFTFDDVIMIWHLATASPSKYNHNIQ